MSANACVRSFGTASDASTCVRGTIKNDIAAETELARMIRRYKRLLIAFCNRYKTTDKDPLVAQEAAKQCAERQLAVREGGWCSYYDADKGFEACYLYGLCGVCEDNGFRHSILLTVISVLLRLLVHSTVA